MEDNGRLILDTTVSGEDAVNSDTSNTQTFNTSTPAAVDNTAALDVSNQADGIEVDGSDSIPGDGDILFLPLTIDFTIIGDASLPIDARIVSNQWTPTEILGQFDPQFAMATHLRNTDAYITIVDMLGRQQPGVHHLLKEHGNGYITYENSSRILIL
jgi:hypothetical protein